MLLVAIFFLGYLAIVFEHPLAINKSASALLVGVACWTVHVAGGDWHVVNAQLAHHMGELSQILFFLLGAMTIVELIDAHDGFDLITSRITTLDRRALLAAIAALAFVLSAVLDNLTTAIVMVTLVRKLVGDEGDRRFYAGVVVIAANSGGVWSPIGDVTTTMLWVGEQVTTTTLSTRLIVPALVSVVVPVAWIGFRMKGKLAPRPRDPTPSTTTTLRERRVVLFAGLGVLLFVPVWKTVTQLPPFLGILLGLGALWAVTEIIHKKKNDEGRGALSVGGALQRIDAPSILFFLGILLAIGALDSAGILTRLARGLDDALGNRDAITLVIGLSSAVIDNVPLVAAAQGMYPLSTLPTDHGFWIFLAYCAGTGGSILIIGSAAGVAVMGIQRIAFTWYLRHISLPALAGYAAGAATYLAMAA